MYTVGIFPPSRVVYQMRQFRVPVNFLQPAWDGGQECVSKCGGAKRVYRMGDIVTIIGSLDCVVGEIDH